MGKRCDVSKFMFFIINVFVLLNRVSAYYCNHDLCREEQYCCGDNLCCDYVYSPWYFWAGVVFMVVMLSACGGLFRYYRGAATSYVVLQQDFYAKEGLLTGVVIERDVPPPYADSQAAHYQRLPPYQDKAGRL